MSILQLFREQTAGRRTGFDNQTAARIVRKAKRAARQGMNPGTVIRQELGKIRK